MKKWRNVEKFLLTVSLKGSEVGEFQKVYGIMKLVAENPNHATELISNDIDTLEMIYEKFMEFFRRAEVGVSEIGDYITCEKYLEELVESVKDMIIEKTREKEVKDEVHNMSESSSKGEGGE